MLEEQMKAAGVEPRYTPVEHVAAQVVDALRANRFWIMPESEHTDETIRARSQSMLDRANPTYLRQVPG